MARLRLRNTNMAHTYLQTYPVLVKKISINVVGVAEVVDLVLR